MTLRLPFVEAHPSYSSMVGEVPYGECQCGCGRKTRIASKTDRSAGQVKGEPLRYIPAHAGRALKARDRYVEEDRGYSTPCWIWVGQRFRRYANLHRNGKNVLAHRWYYEQEHGEIPEGLTIDHLCRQGLCVNPAHMEVVTGAENTQRAKAKLTKDQVALVRSSSARNVELARDLDVHVNTIYRIRHGLRWKV